MPAGFAHSQSRTSNNNLYVNYAKQNDQRNDVVPGAGLGFVNVFTTDGVLIKRFASRGVLNAPWAVTRATQNFGRSSGGILIGNFGQGGISLAGSMPSTVATKMISWARFATRR